MTEYSYSKLNKKKKDKSCSIFAPLFPSAAKNRTVQTQEKKRDAREKKRQVSKEKDQNFNRKMESFDGLCPLQSSSKIYILESKSPRENRD